MLTHAVQLYGLVFLHGLGYRKSSPGIDPTRHSLCSRTPAGHRCPGGGLRDSHNIAASARCEVGRESPGLV
jgi:hypothetical protein